MNDDTEFSSINTLGREVVEANLSQCWADLGSPTYGTMTFEPKYITVSSGSNPATSVEYRNTAVYVSSSHTLQSVVLTFSDGSTRTWTSPGGSSGTFQYNSKVVTNAAVKSTTSARARLTAP
jgi:hypothetical protein